MKYKQFYNVLRMDYQLVHFGVCINTGLLVNILNKQPNQTKQILLDINIIIKHIDYQTKQRVSYSLRFVPHYLMINNFC